MTPGVLDLTRWGAALSERLAGTAVVAGASSPGHARQYWAAGDLAGQPVTPSTVFYAASVTKQLVAALVARAVIDGLVDPQTSIRTFLPGLPAWTGPIRVDHLLHHTAGLPQPADLAVALGYADDAAGWSQLDNDAVLAALHQVAPPSVPPGQVFGYDNTGYVLLAELLRAVYGRSVVALAGSTVFTPLGMTGSRLGGPAPVVLPGHPPPPATVGDGGLWTTPADLLTWLEAMNEGGLGVDLTGLVQSPGRLDDGTVLDYAWGIGPRPGPAGRVYLHGGEWPGWCAMTVRCPATATAVAIMAATEDMPTVSAAALELHGLLAGSASR
jgi:CubicO group peptidase (beta-lactamase class C family)